MEVPRGLVYRPCPSHGAQNEFDRPHQSRVYRTSSSSSYVTYGLPLGDTALHTTDDRMVLRDTREILMDNGVHDLYACADLSRDTEDTQEEYCCSYSTNLMDILPSHCHFSSPPGMSGSTLGIPALAASIYQGNAYSPYSAVSPSMVRLKQVVGQLPLPIRPNEPMGWDFTPGTSNTSNTSSQRFFSPQSPSGRDPIHG